MPFEIMASPSFVRVPFYPHSRQRVRREARVYTIAMTKMRDEFLSEEDLDLRNLSWEELIAYWNLWLEQAQATNDLDEAFYSHGVFAYDPAVVERQKAEKRK